MSDVRRLKVLYVDDEPINTTLFKLNLKKTFEVLTASSADEGLQKLQEEPDVDVVVSDFKMPGKNGVAFLKEVKERFQKPGIILTAYDQNDEVSRAIEEGYVDLCLEKPMDKNRMIQEVQHYSRN